MNKTQDRIKEAATPATNGTSKETTPQTQEQKDKALIAKLRSLNKELQEQIENALVISSSGVYTSNGQFLHERSKALGKIRTEYFDAETAKDAAALRKQGMVIWNQQLVHARKLAGDGGINDSNNTIGLIEFDVKDSTVGVIMTAKLFPSRILA